MSEDQSSSGSGKKGFLDRLTKAFHAEPRDRDELKELLNESLQRGVLDPDALAMMLGVLEVSETQVQDVMVPRSQMVVVPRDGRLEQFLPVMLESGHSRFPVIGEDKDEVEGILLAKDLLRYFAQNGQPFNLTSWLRPALVIPETKPLNLLLRDFRASRSHLAIVVDEYGGVAGLITMEDVLEEIVGEIDDEHDEEEAAPLVSMGDNRYKVNALYPIEEFNETFHARLSEEEFDTIGGLLLAEFGRVPENGERMVLADRYEFCVVESDPRRIIGLEMNVVEPGQA